MPWLDIVSREDWCSLWYITNSPTSLTTGFDPAKPTVLLLHPVFLDTTWLRAQFDDTRLSEGYNLVGFDMRCHGHSNSTPSGRHDIWVETGDVAFFCHRLRLPPVHVFAAEGIASYCALRFAALFPEMVLSLTLCQIPPPEQMRWVREYHERLSEEWASAKDLTSIENIGMDYVDGFIGDHADPDLRDEMNAFFQRYISPRAQARLQEAMNVVYTRTHMEKNVLEAIVQPTLIIQGDWSKMNPLEFAEKLVNDLVNVEGGARLYTARGARGYITVIPTCAVIVNQTFTEFLASLPPYRSDNILPYVPLEVRMRQALQRLSELVNNPEVAKRDPRCPMSFSQLTPGHVAENVERVAYYARRQATAFSPLGPDGWPIRAFSQRPAEQSPVELVKKPAKPAPQPTLLGIIPIGPAWGRLVSRRTSDQDLHAKLAKAHDRGNAETKSRGGGRPTSGEFGGKLQRGRRGTVVPDSQAALDGKYAKKKMVGSRF